MTSLEENAIGGNEPVLDDLSHTLAVELWKGAAGGMLKPSTAGVDAKLLTTILQELVGPGLTAFMGRRGAHPPHR